MEGRTFDDVIRMLGRAGGRRALLIGLGGLAAARLAGLGPGTGSRSVADAPPAAAKKKKKKKCKPACVNGYTCVKVGRKRACQCLAPGTACGEFCCPAGQACSGGACVSPASPTPSPSPSPTATGTAVPPTATSAPPTPTQIVGPTPPAP